MMTPQNIRTDDVINLRTINMRGNAIVRFVSAEPRDAGPHLPHWAPDVARVVLEGKNRPPLGYYELHAGASLVLDLQAFDKTEAVLKVLAGTVSVEAFGLGPLLTRKGETCIFYEKRAEPTPAAADLEARWSGEYVDDAEPAPAPPNGVGTVPAGEPIRQEHLNTVDQAEPEKDQAEQLAAYVATVRSLSARLEQAEQTRDAAQKEASRQTDRARQAFEDLKMERAVSAHAVTEIARLERSTRLEREEYLRIQAHAEEAREGREAWHKEAVEMRAERDRLQGELNRARADAAPARADAEAWHREAERRRMETEQTANERDAAAREARRLAACLESTRATSDAWRGQAHAAEQELQAERLRAEETRGELEVVRLRSEERGRTIDQLHAELDRRRSK